MKKIYNTLAAVALCSLSANAMGFVPEGINRGFSSATDNLGRVEAKTLVADGVLTTRATSDDIAGAYEWVGYWMLTNKTKYQYGCLTVDIEGTKAYVSGFSGTPTGEVITLEGTFNPAAGTISIPTQDCGLYDDGESQGTLRFIYEEWVSETSFEPVNKPMVLTFENGQLKFPKAAIVDITVFVGNEALGYMTLAQANETMKYPNKLDNTGWSDYGVASFTDPWVGYLFDVTEEERTWNVKVQKTTTAEGSTYIRLVDPYGEAAPDYIQQYNESPCQGSIVIDITDEKCVMAVASPAIPSGFSLDEIGLGMFYTYSEAGYEWYDVVAQGEEPYTYEELREGLGTRNIGEIKDDVIYIYKCSFGGGIRAQFALNTHWEMSGTSADMTAKIALDLSGVNDVVAEDADAPVKYYNLQGMEVKAPEAGQLVIKKQGTKTSKYIAK